MIASKDQGRITSYYRRFQTDDVFDAAVVIGNQVILYQQSIGASQGLDYLVNTLETHEDYERISFASLPADRYVALRVQPNEYFVVYTIVMQEGPYVIVVQTIAYHGASDRLSVIEQYARKALAKVTKSFPPTPTPAPDLKSYTIRPEDMSPRYSLIDETETSGLPGDGSNYRVIYRTPDLFTAAEVVIDEVVYTPRRDLIPQDPILTAIAQFESEGYTRFTLPWQLPGNGSVALQKSDSEFTYYAFVMGGGSLYYIALQLQASASATDHNPTIDMYTRLAFSKLRHE